jgi:hypothetical protein
VVVDDDGESPAPCHAMPLPARACGSRERLDRLDREPLLGPGAAMMVPSTSHLCSCFVSARHYPLCSTTFCKDISFNVGIRSNVRWKISEANKRMTSQPRLPRLSVMCQERAPCTIPHDLCTLQSLIRSRYEPDSVRIVGLSDADRIYARFPLLPC